MATLPAPKTVFLKEGALQKRQRGKSVKGNDYSGLKFQSRLVSLNTESLRYYRPIDKKYKGKFPVSSIAFVEEVPPNTFGGIKHGFQIGNKDQSEVMFFGAGSDKDRIEWMEAIRLGARMSKNVMISRYHPGAFGIGKTVQGQWSCCKNKERTALGCHEIGFRARTQSAMNFAPNDEDDCYMYYDDDDDDDDDNEFLVGSLPPQFGGGECSTTFLKTRVDSPHDTTSVMSADSGVFGSRTSLLSAGSQGSPSAKVTEQQEGESSRQRYDHAISEMLAKHDYGLLFTTDYGAALNSLDFRGNDTFIAGGKNGKVCVLDMNSGHIHSDDLSEVTSVETWRSLLLISTKDGVWLRDLDNTQVNYQLEFLLNDALESIAVDTNLSDTLLTLEHTSAKEYFGAFTPDGSRIVIASDNALEVKKVEAAGKQVSQSHVQKLPGKILLLSVSPDPKLPKMVVGVVKNENLVLCICDYTDDKGYSEHDIGVYDSSCRVQAHFLPSDPVLAVGHGKNVTLVKFAEGESRPDFHTFTTEKEITSLRYSPIGDDLVLGTSDGDVTVLDGTANTAAVRHTLEFSLQSSAAVTAITFSKDCSTLAVGQSDGTLNLVKRSFFMKGKIEHNQPPRHSVTIPASGGTLKFEDDDITLVFPTGFIAQPSLTFECSVTSHENPHTFPDGVRPVSAVLSLHPQTKENFVKPIEIKMPHFIDLETEDDCKRLVLLVAGPNENGLNFKEISRGGVISLSTSRPYERRIQYASFNIEHCCHFCVGEYLKERTDKAGFVLIRAESKLNIENDSRKLFLHHCFCYNLPTCTKLVKWQFQEELYTLTNIVVRFSDDRDPCVHITVDNSEELEKNGWQYYIENGTEDNKIYPKDVNFWDIPTAKQLVHMCEQRIYPPRLILRVFSDSSISKDTYLKVAFPGVVCEVQRRKPVLTVSLKGASKLVISRVTSSHSIATRGRHPSQTVNRNAEDALQSSFHFICEAVSQTVELAVLLYSMKLLSKSQFDKYVASDDLRNLGLDPKTMQMIQNCQLLRHVQTNISEDPGKLDALCAAFEELQLPHCSQRLRDELHESGARNLASTSTLSGSEMSYTSASREPDSVHVCEESTPRLPETGHFSFENVPQQYSESDIPVFHGNASTGIEG